MEQPLTAEARETRAGNYFVANYPPFSFWTREAAGDVHATLRSAPVPGTPLGVYIHIPFCRKRCHFCYFKVYTDQNAAQVQRYLDAAVTELKFYAASPFVEGRKPEFIYFGGGTPSYLSARQLAGLTERLQRLLPWDQAGEVAFECEPGTLTEPKLRAIRGMGVTRLSLGIENFDDRILEINGRAHRSREILRSYEWARATGFEQINVDLISGMVEETDSNWQRCVEQTVALSPDSVTIYQMEIPYNTTVYREMKAAGQLAAPVAGWDTKRKWVDHAFQRLEDAGYTVVSAYTAVKDPGRSRFLYRDRLWEGADLIPIGVASFGHLGGMHVQNEHDQAPYLERVERGELPLWRAIRPTDEERLIREMVLQMKLGHIRRSYFQRKFGLDIAERFAGQFSRLRDSGYLAMDGDSIRYTRDGLLQVDSLLHAFFLPQHRDARYA
jgi:oxygen-independent coproporphyrinogen III oxidase